MPKKSLGQHFLKCDWVVSTLIKAGEINKKDIVLEIGPGTGVLTRELVKHAKQVIAVEKDEKLAKNLAESLKKEGISNVKIIPSDILLLLHRSKIYAKYKVVGNIPYYLTSRLIRILLEDKQKPKIIVLTIQKEVAERIVAKPPKMNLLALSVQAYGKPEIVKKVPADCFYPEPKVDSAIIKISDIYDHFLKVNQIKKDDFFKIIRKAFSQKRKILRNSLRGLNLPKELVKKRPEELSLEQWAKLIIEAKSL